MTDWTSGYVADIGYTYGYYTELNPARIRQAFLRSGLVVPEIGTACELGFGQGLSTVMHAAAAVTRWYGTDFNPSQAAFADELVRVSESGAQLFDQSFEEFCKRDDLPQFDYIGLHGIWTWVSDENRRIIVDFIRRKLKVGGVLYISYNCEAGWASMVPLRRLLTDHAAALSAPGAGIVPRVDAALAFADKVLEKSPKFANSNPTAGLRLKQMMTQGREYLAHEYFNRDWQPMSFSQMSSWLADAKLDFACSAHMQDLIGSINLTAEQQAVLAEISDQRLRETARDLMVNQSFRRDYWVKGARKLSRLEQLEAARQQRFILVTPKADVTMSVQGALGEATMAAEVYGPLLEMMSDHKPHSFVELEKALRLNFESLEQALMVLVGKMAVIPVQDDKMAAKVKPACDRLNRHLLHKSRSNGDVLFLVSPLTGGGYNVTRFSQIFLLASATGKKSAQELAEYAWQIMLMEGRKAIRDGVTLETPEDNLAYLAEKAQKFQNETMPILIGLRIAG